MMHKYHLDIKLVLLKNMLALVDNHLDLIYMYYQNIYKEKILNR